jgi:hypothetical protein
MKLAALALLALSACATVPNTYDGQLTIPETSGTFVPVTISNNRSRDVDNPPTFFLVGSGRHSLGVVSGEEKRTVLIDEKWLPSDGCVNIVAHYVGRGDLAYSQFCWRKGDVIEVTLDEQFNPVAAWAHR